ncbi:cytochrome-c peroxidase [Zobellia alginiliquefaciens]|uniref:cytochrome-c peroxidase n=1 Tax=Zobellia alginiliquefaciens TaxID=3032586 RepID=UPI0023E42C27|nr:cytochrome c peroxidase [Zobellia alginiliquefaciens]
MQIRIKNNKGVYAIISLFVFFISCKENKELAKLAEPDLAQLLTTNFKNNLGQCSMALDSMQGSMDDTTHLKTQFIEARNAFKRLEPTLAFIEPGTYNVLNAPNILKVEEEDVNGIKIKMPSGFQVLEENLYADSLDMQKIESTISFIKNRLTLLDHNIDYGFAKPHHVLWMVRDGFIRVSLTGITGFDSPVLERSLPEAIEVYGTLKELLIATEYLFTDTELYNNWINEIDDTIAYLSDANFETFDRYHFIKKHTHKQMEMFNTTVKDWNVSFPFTMAVNNNAASLFENDTFNNDFFTDHKSGGQNPDKIALGKLLFNDTSLSTNGTISCNTCHLEDKAFTDGLAKSAGQTRNSPTLTYAGLQQDFFYDKRSGSLEGQIISVVENETEFHSDLHNLTERVKASADYNEKFEKLFTKGTTDYNIRNAIAQYIRSLSPFDSKFDKNIKGKEETLTASEINGFNLFMGKAKCATCHFAPVFNGTVPVAFKETEMEVIGVPTKNDTVNALIDPDLGRFNFFGTEERKHFFKTPTVRNIEKTGPYMHNGVYNTLEEVMDFYNRGGGAGIGIEAEYQTLPPDPLNLTEEEQQDIIAFMRTLTDTRFLTSANNTDIARN